LKIKAIIVNSDNSSFYIDFEADSFESAAEKAGSYYDLGIGDRPVGNRGATIKVLITDGITTKFFKVIGWMSPRYSAEECASFETSDPISLQTLFDGF